MTDYGSFKGKWNDNHCSHKQAFICEQGCVYIFMSVNISQISFNIFSAVYDSSQTTKKLSTVINLESESLDKLFKNVFSCQ